MAWSWGARPFRFTAEDREALMREAPSIPDLAARLEREISEAIFRSTLAERRPGVFEPRKCRRLVKLISQLRKEAPVRLLSDPVERELKDREEYLTYMARLPRQKGRRPSIERSFIERRVLTILETCGIKTGGPRAARILATVLRAALNVVDEDPMRALMRARNNFYPPKFHKIRRTASRSRPL